MGVTRQTAIATEQGRYSPSLEVAFKIARVFDLPLETVFQYPDERAVRSGKKTPITAWPLLAKVGQPPPKQRIVPD